MMRFTRQEVLAWQADARQRSLCGVCVDTKPEAQGKCLTVPAPGKGDIEGLADKRTSKKPKQVCKEEM